MLNVIVGYWAYIQGPYIPRAIGGLIFGMRCALYAEVYSIQLKKACIYFLVIDTYFWVHIEQLIRWVLNSIQW